MIFRWAARRHRVWDLHHPVPEARGSHRRRAYWAQYSPWHVESTEIKGLDPQWPMMSANVRKQLLVVKFTDIRSIIFQTHERC